MRRGWVGKQLARWVSRLRGYPTTEEMVRCGMTVGRDVHLGPQVLIDVSHCWLVSIGDEATLAPRVTIIAHDASTKRHIGYTKIGAVRIGRRAFIGAGA